MTACRKLDSRRESAGRQRSPGRVDAVSSELLPDRRRGFVLGAVVLLLVLSGCSAFSRDEDSGMPDMSEMLSIDRIRGPLERSLSGEVSPLEQGRRFTEAEQRELRMCREAYDKQDYPTAIKLSKKAAKKLKETSLGEEAQYYLAESYFAMGKYASAQDAFDQLFVDYPSTRYVEPATRRLFTIAREWLEVSEPAAKSEIRQVSGEAPADDDVPVKPPSDPTLRVRILPNFHDPSRPMFDTQGRALECLKSIWMNDPTGPLADDALMLTATYYQRHQNFVEADRYFEILREEYPNSPHLEAAFLLGSHVKQMSYQGPYYEGSELAGARRLKEQSLQLFPASLQRQQLRKDLDELYLMEAERAWARIEYYQKKRRPRAVAIACVELLNDYPDTGFAKEARAILRSIDSQVIEDLPEIAEFIQTLPPAEPESSQPDESPSSRPAVKSVSGPRLRNTGERDSEEQRGVRL